MSREEKSDVTQSQICEIVGLDHIQKEQVEKSPLTKTQPLAVSPNWFVVMTLYISH